MLWMLQMTIFLMICGIIHVFTKLWYRLIISPLSHIPSASVLAPVSRLLWAFPLEYEGRLTLQLPILHEKYGSLIRIGPNELSFYSIELYKSVYSAHSPYAKDARVYGQFIQDNHPSLFSMTNANDHTRRRRLMGQLFNHSKISALEGMMIEKVKSFIRALNEQKSSPIQVVLACRALDADITSTFAFGEEIGAVSSWTRGKALDMIAENDKNREAFVLFSNIPIIQSVWSVLESPIHVLTGWQSHSTFVLRRFDRWTSSHFERLRYTANPYPGKYPNFISTMIRSQLPPKSALSEAKEMLGPGTDSTGVTCAHILWGLAHIIEFQENLAQDLANAGWPTGILELEDIARLKAAVKEGIRWAGAAAAMLPRLVPSGGAILAGKFIPGGTLIGTSPIWYLRDKIAFPSPELYRPSRWLDDEHTSTSPRSFRDEYYIPFSRGSNDCIAAHFAFLEICLTVSQVLKYFRLTLPGSGRCRSAKEATLPERLEWITAVLVVNLEVQFEPRSQLPTRD